MNKPKNLDEHYNSLNDTGKRMYDHLKALINQTQPNVITKRLNIVLIWLN
jgi:hypothetical protein